MFSQKDRQLVEMLHKKKNLETQILPQDRQVTHLLPLKHNHQVIQMHLLIHLFLVQSMMMKKIFQDLARCSLLDQWEAPLLGSLPIKIN
jgi:hypothetical protein